MDGAEYFLNNIFENKIRTCIVTHSDRNTIDFILKKIDLLNKIDLIITKDDYINKKPHPEPYILALNKYPDCKSPIGFEDSYKGFLSLKKSGITSVFVNNNSYPFFHLINPIIHIDNFNQICQYG